MPRIARLLSLFVAFAGFGLAQPALAGAGSDISTPAWTNRDLALHVGPGDRFDVALVLPGGIPVSVDHCNNDWCRVRARLPRVRRAVHGWVYLYALSFGHGPNSIWWPPQYRHPGVSW
jgi:SH3-like domain-containing protein